MSSKARKISKEVVSSKFRQLLPPYEDYHSTGPFLRKGNIYGRMYINLLKTTATGIYGILYARYLLEVKLGRPLNPNCEVDHIDGCNWNDSIENLQELPVHSNRIKGTSSILTSYQHAKTHIMAKCPECGIWFDRKRCMLNGAFAYCSRTCNGKASHHLEDFMNYKQEFKEIPPPDLSSLSKPFYEPFENYSVPWVHEETRHVCCMCGNPVCTPTGRFCIDCRKRYDGRLYGLSENEMSELKNAIIESVSDMFANEGKVVMRRLATKFNLSDRGLAKRITKLFGKPYHDVIHDIITGN